MNAQQVNQFPVCTQNQEIYNPGGYDSYGNYIPGNVTVRSWNTACSQRQSQYPSYSYEGPCRPVPALLGALLGGGIGGALSRGDGRWWAVPVGAAVGGAVFGCN